MKRLFRLDVVLMAMSPMPHRRKHRNGSPGLCPNEKHITNTNSGHEIHKEQPQLVIDAIREVVEAVRSGKRQLTQ
jgi:hypothetical protein